LNISNVTYINLKSNKDRLDNILSILNHCPYPYFKTDGVAIASSFEHLDIIDPFIIDPFLFRKDEKFIFGTIGCFLAHKQAIKNLIKVVEDAEAYSMILEDDISITDNFWPIFKSLDEQKYEEADILFIDNKIKKKGHPKEVCLEYYLIYLY